MRLPTRAGGVLALVTFPLLTGATAHAGTIEAYGFRTGATASRLVGNFGEAYGGDYRAGFTATAFCRFRFTRAWSFEPGIAWVAKGGKGVPGGFTNPGPPATITEFHATTRVSYIEFPLVLRYDMPVEWSARPYLVTGAAPAVRVGVSQTVETSTRPLSGATMPNLQYAFIYEQVGTLGGQRVVPFDMGLIAGVGVSIGSGSTRFLVEGRYTHGLTDMIEGGVESRNEGFALTLGVEFR